MKLQQTIRIPVFDVELEGDLVIPQNASGIVIFSHGSGSSRKSTRNRMVARLLQQHQIATLLFDLLTPEEDMSYANRFNINLLTSRLVGVTRWFEAHYADEHLPIGYFGASTGAASALKAAAVLPQVKAVVSRGGRPDLAIDQLPGITAPVLLIVGSLDHDVLQLNRMALANLGGERKLKIINGAAHLFEEPGKLEEVAEAALAWFETHFAQVAEADSGI